MNRDNNPNTVELRSDMELGNKIIDALCYSYQGVYYVNLTSGEIRSYRMARYVREKFGEQFHQGSYETNIYAYVRKLVMYEDQRLFEPILTIASLRSIFSRQMSYSFSYRFTLDEEIHYGQVEALKVLDSSDEIVLAFKNMDKQHQLEKNLYEKERQIVKAMSRQLNEVARGPLMNVIEQSKAAKEAAKAGQDVSGYIEAIQNDGETLLRIFNLIFAEENTDREKIEETIMKLDSLS
ncbi:hypothetical protein [uncultured Anaerovibrio sp.]|uniref:hypothetical protein n=1 Tax=uncultured Anaerovibrio sp. TaxID=361586 RepID=UPI002623BF32|nr:hypothetical protein [uncultured Anaerovibrio sp.]